MNKRKVWGGASLVLTALALTGCGGGGHSGDSRTTIHGELRSGDQTLSDGSYVDVYSCTARDDGSAQVDLKSSDFDSFLIVGEEDGSGNIHTVASDDNGGSDQNSHADFGVGRDIRYFVAATNADEAVRTGSYELDFSDKLKDVREETDITPAVRAAAARAVQESRARQKPAATP